MMTDTPTRNADLIQRLREMAGSISNNEWKLPLGIVPRPLLEAADALEAAERVIAGIRAEVLAFAHLMERELRNNDHKTGWKDAAPEWLANRTFEEAQELCDLANSYEVSCTVPVSAVDRDAVAGEAADVANMAMMVADVCGCLDDWLARHATTQRQCQCVSPWTNPTSENCSECGGHISSTYHPAAGRGR